MNEQAATASETCATEEYWDEFGRAAWFIKGYAAQRRDNRFEVGELRDWRLGWLWACYEDLNPRMLRDGRFRWHRYEWWALAPGVLCVASLNLPIGKWRCYIASVPGENYDNEWFAVAERGTKLPQSVAEALFSGFAQRFVWED